MLGQQPLLGGMWHGYDADWIEGMGERMGYEADQAKIFNRSVKELILSRSKFQSANSGTNVQTNERKMA